MRELYFTIKYALQRAIRGYDERIEKGWGADILICDAIPGIKKFCENELKTIPKKGNEERVAIFKETIKLINNYNKRNKNWKIEIDSYDEMIDYIGSHIRWYWN